MRIDAEIKPMYKLTLGNRDTCRGCYYLEDDWEIVVYGESIQDIIDAAPALMVESCIDITSPRLDIVFCLLYRNYLLELTGGLERRAKIHHEGWDEDPLVLDELPEAVRNEMRSAIQSMPKPDVAEIVALIKDSKLYVQLVEEKKIHDLEKKLETERVRKHEAEERERKMFEELKRKYEG